MRRVLLLLLAVVPLCLGGAILDVHAASDKKDPKVQEQEQVLATLTEKERSLHKDLAAAADDIAALEKDVAAAEAEVQAGIKEETRLRNQLRALDGQYTAASRELGKLLQGLWPVHVQQAAHTGRNLDSWHEADRQFTWLAAVYDGASHRLERLETIKEPLAQGLATHEAVLQEARASLKALNVQKGELVKKKISFDNRLADVRKEKRTVEEELKTILAAVQSVKFTMERKLEQPAPAAKPAPKPDKAPPKEDAKPEAKPTPPDAPKKAEESEKAPEKQAPPKQRKIPEALAALGIDKLKGRLPWPVEGGTVVKTYKPNANPPVRGVAFKVAENAPVYAVAAGKVVHVDTLRGFGRVVIVMHGDDYYSLYAYLSQSAVTTGQELAMGETVGVCGFYPDLKAPGLYFELRFHQKAINPKTWLAAR